VVKCLESMGGGRHESARAWEHWEDAIISQTVGEGGHRWSQIVRRLPGRTQSSVRNRYQRMTKGLTKRGINKCKLCGQQKLGHTCTMPRAPPGSPFFGRSTPRTSHNMWESESCADSESYGEDGEDETPLTARNDEAPPLKTRLVLRGVDAGANVILPNGPISVEEETLWKRDVITPTPPLALVTRSYSTASSMLANLAEPLTPELQSLSCTSKVQNKANAAVLKSMPSFLKAYDECDTENPMMSVWNELRAEHALIDA